MFISILIALFLLGSSSYIALRLGALPWPIIFSVIASAALLKIFRKPSVHDINTTQAGASIGGLMASAVVFTLPAAYLLEIPLPSTLSLIMIAVSAGILGVILSIPLRKQYVEKENLPYPSGTAGAKLLKQGFRGGKTLRLAIVVGFAAAFFALSRDLWFPSITLFGAAALTLTILPMPLAVATGYILGKRPSYSWFAGSAVGWLILIPLLVFLGNTYESMVSLVQNIGMGIVLGSGIGFFAIYTLPRIKEILRPIFKKSYLIPASAALLISAFVLTISGVPMIASLLAALSTLLFVAVAARMTGETNIDPLEQFGIVAALAIGALYAAVNLDFSAQASLLIVFFVSTVAAVAGDIGHDFRSAKIIGTDYRRIVRADLVTVIAAGFAAPFVLKIIANAFELFTDTMPAPQAQLVAGSISGFAYPYAFFAGFALAFLFEFVFRRKSMMMPFGIGMFLGLPFGLLLLLGGLISKKSEKGVVIAAAVMGGEGIAGFSAAALMMLGFAYATGAMYLLAFSAIGLLVSVYYLRR